jgi:2-polyprenyl-6-methoxyphenol hydroxylase-like FAD-dependent oxidoreductase
MTLIPGVGEIFQLCFRSFTGPISAVALAAIPGGPLDLLSPTADPHTNGDLPAAVRGLTRRFAPSLYERIDPATFALARPADLLQGQITPVARRPWAALAGGRHAVAVGDAWILNDPLAAQGANLGSHAAFLLGDHIIGSDRYDQAFCEHTAQSMWAAAHAPTLLSNALVQPPPPHLVDLFARASHDQRLADRFANGFGEPEAMLTMLAPGSDPAQDTAGDRSEVTLDRQPAP